MPPNESSDYTTGSPNLAIGSLLALTFSLLIGGAMGLVLLATSFSSIPTDVARLGVLTRALKTGSDAPDLVVFGNSALMSGFDANAYTASVMNAPLAWNCASTGQTLTEAALLTQELPESTKHVVYALQVRAGPSARLIHPNKFNTFYMSGLRPNEDTKKMLGGLGDADLNALLDESWIEQLVASRWAVRQLIDRVSRQFLRADLELEKATTDLFHPQAYSKPIKKSITASFIKGQNANYKKKQAMLPTATLPLARALAEHGAATGRKITFLFPPSHPGIFEPNQDSISKIIMDFRAELAGIPNTRVLSAIDLLQEDQFIDDMHPTNAGALTLTEFLAGALSLRAHEERGSD